MHPPSDNNNNNSHVEFENSSEITVTVEDGSAKNEPKKEGYNKWSLLKNWPLMSSIIVYCIFSLHDMAYSEVIHL